MTLKETVQFNRDHPFNKTERRPPKDHPNSIVHDIEIDNAIGETIKTYLVKPKGNGHFPVIEFFHWLEPEAENSNRSEFLPVALELAKEGYISILPDAFWSTTPEKFKKNPVLWWKTDAKFDSELCKNQLIEFIRIHDFVSSLDEIDKNRIGIVGHDFGAMYATLLINFIESVKSFVIMAATTKFSHWFKFGSKLSDTELQLYDDQMKEYNPINYIKLYSPASILFQFSTNDFYVPKEVAENYFETAQEPKLLKWYDAGHGLNEQAFEDMKEFIRKSV